MNKIILCHDCAAKEGEAHSPGCDMETCPFCEGQLISCGCGYKLLNIDISIGTWAYSNGLTDKQSNEFEKLLEEKGRIPYVHIPVLCIICGKNVDHNSLHEAMIPDEDWEKYIVPILQSEVLCKSCIDRQKQLFPNGWKNANRHTI